MAKMTKKYVCYSRYLRNHISYDCHLWYTYVKWLYLLGFVHFFKILILCVVRGGVVDGQKMVQNEKNLCLSCSISQESYIILFLFMVLMCKMIISPGALFHFFKTLIFWVVRGVKRKNSPKWQKIMSAVLDISGTMHHMIVIWHTHV